MVQQTAEAKGSSLRTPERLFVIQLRSDSTIGERRLRGRVEHVMSDETAQFTSLGDLLALLERYTAAGTTPP